MVSYKLFSKIRKGSLLIGVSLVMPFSLALSAHAKGAPTSSSPTSFTVQLANTSVAVDNLSQYTNSRVSTLVQWADRGMATTDPLHNVVAGEMSKGDQVVVTNYGIYWLDITGRGGLLSGIWPLVPSTADGADFQYLVNGSEWEPNEFLPGSDGSNKAAYATGQGLNALATGAADGSCTAGKGTFVLNNSDNCGIAENGARVSLTSSVSGSAHTYSFSGTLYQEGTRRDEVMVDSYGNSAKINFKLTYTFNDYTDANYSYGSANGPDAQRVRSELTLTPTSSIHFGTLVVAGNSDNGDITYPFRKYNYSNTMRQTYGCNAAAYAALTVGTLCEGPTYGFNYITQPNTLPNTLSSGDFVTEQQSPTVGDLTDRSLTYLIPYSSAYRLPERIDHIWNSGLNVSSMDVDYFNNEDVLVNNGSTLQLGYDLQTVPHS